MFSVQPGLRSSNDLRVGRKMATFQLFFQSSRAKDLSAALYVKWWYLFEFRNSYNIVSFHLTTANFVVEWRTVQLHVTYICPFQIKEY